MPSSVIRLLLAFAISLSAFSISATARIQPPTDYRPYFKTVKHALEQVAAENFNGALTTYLQLFRQYRFAFPRDVFNALQLAIQTNSVSVRDSLVRRGAESGVNRKTFLQNPKVRAAYLPADSLLFEELFLKGRTVWATRVDTALRREMVARYKREQASKGTPDYRSVCTDNLERIIALAKAGRFPGEERIGVADNLVNDYVIPTLCHHPFSYTRLRQDLLTAMQEGQMQPLSIIYAYGFNQTAKDGHKWPGRPMKMATETASLATSYNTAFGRQSEDTAAVNRARAEMYIVSKETERRLAEVARAHGLTIALGW